MKVKTIEIAWHRRLEANHNDPVLSVDFLDDRVFATGGGDHEVKIWRLNVEGEEPVVEFCYSLKGHLQSVNVVRFSPDKKMLASAGDDGSLYIWSLEEKVCSSWSEITKENCFTKRCIRGHSMDIYDISWCSNSRYLVSSGTDSNVIIWGIDGTPYCRIHDHSGYIQGVDWSQDDSSLLSVANDRTVRVYSYASEPVNMSLQVDDVHCVHSLKNDHRISVNVVNNKPLPCISVLKKMLFTYSGTEQSLSVDKDTMDVETSDEFGTVLSSTVQPTFTEAIATTTVVDADTATVESESKPKKKEEDVKSGSKGYFMFYGDTVPSFYRRPHSSDEGLLTVIPCGIYIDKEGELPRNCSYLYLNGVWEQPLCCLPVFGYPTVACRFSPMRYEKNSDEDNSMTSLLGVRYNHVFAVASTEEVFIYSTACTVPLFYINNIHYAQICDISWSTSGKYAFTASSDGYCTLLIFEEGELGKEI